MISLNNDIKINKQNLKTQENEILLNFLFTKRLETSKYIINHLININKNIDNQDIDININYEFNLLKKNKYESIFISLESFEYLKLLSINFISIET